MEFKVFYLEASVLTLQFLELKVHWEIDENRRKCEFEICILYFWLQFKYRPNVQTRFQKYWTHSNSWFSKNFTGFSWICQWVLNMYRTGNSQCWKYQDRDERWRCANPRKSKKDCYRLQSSFKGSVHFLQDEAEVVRIICFKT